MAEKIIDLCKSVENDWSSNETQKEKAKNVCTILTQKNKAWLQINANARNDILAILKEVTLDAGLSAEMIEANLSSATSEPATVAPVKKDTSILSYVWLWWEKEPKKAEEVYHELRNQGWTDVYIFAKILSLWYIPKFHEMKYEKSFSWHKFNYLQNNLRFFAMWWAITNGTVNEPIIKWQQAMRDWFMKIAISEEAELKMILNSVVKTWTPWVLDATWTMKIWDRTKLNQRLQALTDLKTAINTWDVNGMKTASKDYADISEKTGSIKKLFKDHWIDKTVKSQLTQKQAEAQEKVKKQAEETFEKEKWKILAEFDRQIKAEQTTIDWHKDPSALQQDLDHLKEEKANLEAERQIHLDEKAKLDADHTRKSAQLGSKWLSPTQITAIEWQLSRIEWQIQTEFDEAKRIKWLIDGKDSQIRQKVIDIRDLSKTNKTQIETATEKKEFLEKLRTATESWDHKEAKKLLQDYEYKNSSVPFKLKPWVDYETFMKTDHVGVIKSKTSNWAMPKQWTAWATWYTISPEQQKYKQERRDVRTKAMDTALSKESDRITKEIAVIEKEIDTIKKEAEKQLQDLEKIAKQDPKKVPELKAWFEKTVEKMNTQIAELEKRWVDWLKKLNPEDLKLVSTKSKRTADMVKTNWWVDWKMSWIWWKIFWVAWITMLAHWAYSWVQDTWFTSETLRNAADIWIWMIPIAWWAYDIWRAFDWEDLNWKEMTTSERWTRFGFWVVWLVPVAWTIVKWSATWVKSTAIATKLAQNWELITEAWHLTGKVVWIWALWFGWLSTATYLLDSKK